jgi:hypothetical protein
MSQSLNAMDKLNLPFDHLPALGLTSPKFSAGTSTGAGTGGPTATGFGQALAHISQPATAAKAAGLQHTIAPGESLTAIVRQQAAQQGVPLNAEQSHKMALELAQRNGISDPNRIQPGQTLNMGNLHTELRALAPTPTDVPKVRPLVADSTRDWMNQRPTQTSQATPAAKTAQANAPVTANAAHPVLKQTLDRAVAKGFIPTNEKKAVHDKIVQLSQKHKFAPDDFARLSLMESDGLNPKATNERCHGIIQFCDGPARGAATVGYADKPKAILGLSVYQQLSLVDTYFQEAGVNKQKHNSLDNLYLAVLQPAARQEQRADAPLNINGPQAKALHEGNDNTQAITRQSIFEGLVKNARQKLSAALQLSEAPKSGPTASQAPLKLAQNDTVGPVRR